ncbi:MAG: bile acid:sodium symporter family protein [Rhodocyclaceae bacterium]|nr:bile acid:sodium symporter family protein [Rhodocyclaceae bacterium]
MNTIFIVLPILTLLMFDLGLILKPGDFRLFVRRPRPLLAGLVGQIVLLPLIAWAVAWVLQPLFFIGLMLIACCPGGSSSNVFSMLARGDVALSVLLTAASSVITLFTVPLIMAWVTQAAGAQVGVRLPVGNLLVQNLLFMAVPIVAGVWLAARRAALAARIHQVLKRLAFALLLFLAAVFFVQHRAAIVQHFPALGAAVSALIVLAMGAGAAVSRALRLSGRERRTIVIETGMQNAAQAIAVAASPLVFNNETIAIPAIVYALMMNVILLSYVAVLARREAA